MDENADTSQAIFELPPKNCSLLLLLLPVQRCRCQSVHCYYYLWGVAGANLFIIITTCAGLQVLVAIHYSVLDARNGYIRNVVV